MIAKFGNLLAKKWYLVALIVICDILFLFFFGRSYAMQFQQLSTQMETMNALLQQGIGGFVESNDAASLIAVQDQLKAIYWVIGKGIAQILATLLLYWTIFEGLGWFAAHKIVAPKKFLDFAWRFALVTVAGFIAIFGTAAVMAYLTTNALASPVPLIGQTGMNLLTTILVFALFYFLLVAYGVVEKGFWKKFYHASIKKITSTGLVYVLGIVGIFLLGKLMVWVHARHVLLSFAFAIFILLPFIAALRVFFIETIKES